MQKKTREHNVKVSAIIPTYNRAKYVVEALESALKQSYTNYEILIIDDGSTDHTKEVLKPFILANQIIYIYKANGGPASARNAGIKITRGEYIAFLDSDDLWLPDKLEQQVKYLDEHKDVGLVFTDEVVFTDDKAGNNKEIARVIFRSNYPGNDLSFKALFMGNYIPILTVMVRRTCIQDVGYFDESPDLRLGGEDYEMWLRIARRYKIGHLPKILAQYRHHTQNVLGLDLENTYMGNIRAIQKLLNLYPNIPEELHLNMKQHYRSYYYDKGRDLYQDNRYRAAVRFLSRSLFYGPFSLKTVRMLILTLTMSLIQLVATFFRKFTTSVNLAMLVLFPRVLSRFLDKPLSKGLRSSLKNLGNEFVIYNIHLKSLKQSVRFQSCRDLKLNVGCGSNAKRGWINIDLVGNPDLSLDLREPLPFPDDSCSIVYCEQFLEHLEYPDHVLYFLKDAYRVLKPGGLISIGVHDTEWPLRAYIQGDEDYFTLVKEKWHPKWCKTKMEHINYHFRQGTEHRFAYDFETLKYILETSGFSDVKRIDFKPTLDTDERKIGTLYVDSIKPM